MTKATTGWPQSPTAGSMAPRKRFPVSGCHWRACKSSSGKPITSRHSTKDCLVSYASNYYSVPAAYTQQQLLLKKTETGNLLICSRCWASKAPSTAGGRCSTKPVGTVHRLIGARRPTVEVCSLHLYAQWAEVTPCRPHLRTHSGTSGTAETDGD